MKGGFLSRRLRWKLTLSYTLVALAVTLVANTLIFVALWAYYNSQDQGRWMAEGLADSTAPRFQTALVQSHPDKEELREVLREELNPARATGDPLGGLLSGQISEDDYVLVVDDEGRLVGFAPEKRSPPTGERYDAGPALAPLLDRALTGEEDPARLNTRTEDGRWMIVAPVKGEDERVLGAVASVSRPLNGVHFLIQTVLGVIPTALVAAVVGALFGFWSARRLTRRLQGLTRAADAWSRGDFSVAAKDASRDELGQLSRDLNRMAGQLENLMHARGELATMEARNRFARDLHDSVKQQVFATSLKVDAARAASEPGGAADSHLARAKEMLGSAQRELNVLIHEMRPAALEGRGLASALRSYAADWTRGSEIPAEVRVTGEREAPLEAEQTLFRVAQEALANVARHSGATKAEVDLSYGADALTLRVADDGKGFDPAHKNGDGGFGLSSMRERLEGLGGRVEVDSKPGKGTRLACVCPLGAAVAEAGSKEGERT